MTVLFWDIDGTLLTTGKAGVPAWEEAVREVIGHDFQFSSFRVAGLTDFQIAVRTFEMLGVEANEEMIRRMVRRYEELLPGIAPTQGGSRAAERPRNSRRARGTGPTFARIS